MELTQMQQPGSTPEPTPAPAPAPAAPTPPAPEPIQLATPGGVHTFTPEKLADRLAKASEKAQQEILLALGVKTVDEAKELLARHAERERAAELERLSKLSETARLEEEKKKLAAERDAERQARESKERELAELKLRSEVRDYEAKLTSLALAAGIRADEVEYALFSYQRELQSRTEDEVAQMPSPRDWFATELKRRRPHVFADFAVPAQVPLTTGAPPVQPDGRPAPAATPKSALDMTPAEWAKYKQDLGVS